MGTGILEMCILPMQEQDSPAPPPLLFTKRSVKEELQFSTLWTCWNKDIEVEFFYKEDFPDNHSRLLLLSGYECKSSLNNQFLSYRHEVRTEDKETDFPDETHV